MPSQIIRKVRKNADFIEATRTLDDLGLEWTLHKPRGKGHPYLAIGPVRFTIACSPSPAARKANVRTQLKRRLREAGIIE